MMKETGSASLDTHNLLVKVPVWILMCQGKLKNSFSKFVYHLMNKNLFYISYLQHDGLNNCDVGVVYADVPPSKADFFKAEFVLTRAENEAAKTHWRAPDPPDAATYYFILDYKEAFTVKYVRFLCFL